MASNVQKTPLARTLEQFTARRILGAATRNGQSLPASVVSVVGSGIVVVKLEIANTPAEPYTIPNLTVPLFGPEYIRYPIQPGCKGFVVAADAYLGGMSGLGGGVASLAKRANLSSLVFFPIGNKDWTASEDPNALVLYGPDGVIIRNLAKTSTVTVGADGVAIAPPAGKPTAIQSDAQITGQIKNPGGGTYSQPITTTDDVTGNNVIAESMVSAPAAAFGTALIAGFAALTTAGGQNLGGGFTNAEYPIPTPTNGSTVTPNPFNGQWQWTTNNVAGFSIAAPTLSANVVAPIVIRIVNGASAGTISFPGMTQWPGVALDTVAGHQFVVIIYGFGTVGASYVVQRLI